MAYNILKGTVEGSVDQHADQEIDGVKVFRNTISASVFYDTDAQSPCATMKDVAIKKIKGDTHNSILICDTDNGARTEHSFNYHNDTLNVKNVNSGYYIGSARYLNDLPVDKFVDKVSAKFLRLGGGLVDVRGDIQIKTGDGLSIEDDTLQLSLAANSGLSVKSKKLKVDPARLNPINVDGQNLSDADLLIISDISDGQTKHTSLSNLYDNFLSIKVPHAVGSSGELQYKGKREFESSTNLSFDATSNTLNVEGKVKSNHIVSSQKLVSEGAVHFNVTKIVSKTYNVQDDDYTILCDSVENKITVNLPPPQNNVGRILIIKKTNASKYKLNSHIVSVVCEEGPIEIGSQADIKMNYSSKTFQSDGENWWIIGSNGS